jgi:uncharacterized membrane protein YhaH (DUF805 family)
MALPRKRAGDWARLVFGLDDRVDRSTYAVAGVVLMAFKYGVEALFVWSATGRLWHPLRFLDPQLKSRFSALSPSGLDVLAWTQTPSWLSWALVLWTLPFIWIGVSMSVRRAADAGVSPWFGLLFFVPYANYVLMLVLAVLPGVAAPVWSLKDRAATHP